MNISSNIINESRTIAVESIEFLKNIKQYYELHANKFYNLDVMDKFFKRHKLPKLFQKET